MDGITVSGNGEAVGTPDTVVVELGVSVLAETVEAATSHAAETAGSLIGSLKSNGVGEASITTTQYSLNPEYDHRSGSQQFIGYRVNNTVRAKISDVDLAGSILDEATKVAGDVAQVSSVAFIAEDDQRLQIAAREAAWEDALAKATQLAELAGGTLGRVVSIRESVGHAPAPRRLERLAAEDGATPIQPGTTSISTSLEVEFAFATPS